MDYKISYREKDKGIQCIISYKNENGELGFDVSIHDSRRTYATNLIAIGLDFKIIAEFMETTVEIVIKTHAHFNNDMYEAGKAKINNFL